MTDVPGIDSDFPLTQGQQAIWFLSQLDASNAPYNISCPIRVTPRLDAAVTKRAMEALVVRHEALRAAFFMVGGKLRQRIRTSVEIEIPVVDATGMSNEQLGARLRENSSRRYDLESGLPVRFELYQRGDSSILHFQVHHIVSDFWSIAMYFDEFVATYSALRDDQQPELDDQTLRYSEYCTHAGDWLSSPAARKSKAYWQEKLSAPLPVLRLPGPGAAVSRDSTASNNERFSFSRAETGEVLRYSEALKVTTFAVLMAAYFRFLSRLAGQDEIVVGIPTLGRSKAAEKWLFGYLVNPLPIRIQRISVHSFENLCASIHADVRLAMKHQRYPFFQIVKDLDLERNVDVLPVYQTMFSFQRAQRSGTEWLAAFSVEDESVEFELGGLTIAAYPHDANVSQFDFALNMGLVGERLSGGFQYRSSAFDQATVEALVREFKSTVLRSVRGAESNELPPPLNVASFLEERAAVDSEAPALEFLDTRLTYAELRTHAKAMERRLRRGGIGAGDIVAVALPHGDELVAVVMALLSMGCKLVLLDYATPPARLSSVLRISRSASLIVAGEMFPAVDVAVIDIREATVRDLSTTESVHAPAPEVYVFTSGTTGDPKCIVLTSENLAHMAGTIADAYSLTRQDRVLQFTSPQFDVFLEELLPTLLAGATLVVRPPDLNIDLDRFESFLREQRISVANIPTAFWNAWVSQMPDDHVIDLPDLRLVVVGGEVMEAPRLARWQRSSRGATRLINAYGPSELTVTALVADVTDADPRAPVPIGTPLPGVDAVVVTSDDQNSAVDKKGVLYLTGRGLSPGYLNDSAATESRFIQRDDGRRWFDTGDVIEYGQAGQLVWAGRLDRQIKRQGVRIELDEVEYHITALDDVTRAAVLSIDERLIAFIETQSDYSRDDLRAALGRSLLPQMIPSEFVIRDELPVTPAGKIDFARLRESVDEPVSLVQHPDAPEDDVRSIVEATLNATVDPTASLFNQGLDSILAVSLAAALSDRFHCQIPVRMIFDHPAISELSHAVGKHARSTYRRAPEDPQGPEIPLSPSQKRVAYLKRLTEGFLDVDHRAEIALSGDLDSLKFHNAWLRTVSRHDVLRMAFAGIDEQEHLGDLQHQLTYIDRTHLDDSRGDYEAALGDALTLAAPPLIKAALVKFAPRGHTFYVSASPLVADLESIARLLAEFQQEYNDAPAATDAGTVVPGAGYGEYARRAARLPDPNPYWREYLRDCNVSPDLAIRRPNAGASLRAETERVVLDAALSNRVRRVIQSVGPSPAAFFLGLYYALIDRYASDASSVGIGTAVTHRGFFGTDRTIGPFTNFAIVNRRISRNASFAALVAGVQEDLLNAIEHQHIDMEELLGLVGEKAGALAVECLFLYHNEPVPSLSLDGLTAALTAHSDIPLPALLTLEVTRDEERFLLDFHFDPGVYEAARISGFAEAYRQLLTSAANDPEAPLARLPVLAESMQHMGQGDVHEWQEDCELLHTTFTVTARKHPLRTAIIAGGRKISYGQLYRFTTRISRVIYGLKKSMAGDGPLVIGILMEKGWEQIVAALGVLRGGGVFAPINPALPEAQVSALLQNVRIGLVITTALHKKLYTWPETTTVLTLDDPVIRASSRIPIRKRTVGVSPDDAAYIMFTSGTTGTPKAVMISHSAALNTIYDLNRRIALDNKDVFFGVSNFHFDLSIYDLFGAFSKGARIVFPDHEKHLDTEHWEALLREHKVTVWNSVPALYQLMLDRLKIPFDSLRYVFLSGDWIPLDLPKRSFEMCPNAALLSLGGATEVSIWSVAYPIQAVDPAWQSIPYGLPLTNQTMCVLDEDMRPCAPDVPGELYIGGDGVALGYYNQPEQTRRTFVQDPWTGDRLYKTNDRATLSSYGYFEILGRLDDHVKVSGQFVNLSAVERELESTPGVSRAAVIAQTDAKKKTELHAFIVSARRSTEVAREIRGHLLDKLPAHMVPAKLAYIERLPLTDNGKVDRKQLTAFDGEFVSFKSEGVAPASEMERKLAAIWEDTLGVSDLSVSDNFFDLGGDSLRAVRVAGLLKDDLGIEVPIQTLIMYQTIEALAPVLEGFCQSSNLETSGAEQSGSGLLSGEIPDVLVRECFLDASIASAGPPGDIPMPDVGRVLLTGATGYLGSRLLVELLRSTHLDVFCITRSDDTHAAEVRIYETLAAITPLTEEEELRIVPVKGDLSKPLLGLTTRDFELLANQLDYIIHCAAEVNFVMPRSALRKTNIDGAMEILRLAARGKPKGIGYVSTVSVFPTIGQDIDRRFMEDDDLNHGLPIVGGYSQSKWIAEHIMGIGRSRGIPINVFRPGVIFGDTRLGDLPEDVLLVSFLKLCANLGSAPDLSVMVDVAPVDYVASAIVALGRTSNKNFHLTNPAPVHLSEFVGALNESGMAIETISPEAWFDAAKRASPADIPGAAIPLLGMAGDIRSVGSIAFGRNLQQFDCTNTLRALAGTDINCPSLNAEFLRNFTEALAGSAETN